MAIVAAMAVPHPPIILPEIGRGEEEKIAKTTAAYREVMKRAASLEPDTVVITSPHATMYSDYFHISPGEKAEGDFGAFRCPEVRIGAEYDEAFSKALADACAAEDLPAGFLGEREPALDHGTMWRTCAAAAACTSPSRWSASVFPACQQTGTTGWDS